MLWQCYMLLEFVETHELNTYCKETCLVGVN